MKTKPLKRQTRGLKQSEAHKSEAFLPVCRCKGTTFFGTCKPFPQKTFDPESNCLRKTAHNIKKYSRINDLNVNSPPFSKKHLIPSPNLFKLKLVPIIRVDALYRMNSFTSLCRRLKIPRTYDSILPKFHFILPKFYFAPPWEFFVCSLTDSHFLGRRVTGVGTHGLDDSEVCCICALFRTFVTRSG